MCVCVCVCVCVFVCVCVCVCVCDFNPVCNAELFISYEMFKTSLRKSSVIVNQYLTL